MKPIQLHSVHWANANEAELAVTVGFLSAVNCLFGPGTRVPLKSVAHTFVDFIVEARRLQRFPARGDIPGIPDLRIPLDHLLARFPLQVWPLPHPHHCPVSFCDKTPNSEMMEAHLAQFHPEVHQVGLYHTEVQLQLVSLLGLGLEVRKRKAWRCPFRGCKRDFDKFIGMYNHVQDDHSGYEKFLYNQVCGFWAPVLCHYNRCGCWPIVAEMFKDNLEQAKLRVIPANSDRATQVWKSSGRMLTDRQLGDMRLMPDLPLEGFLQILRGRASAIPSRETSALVSEMEFEPSIMSDDGFEDNSTRDPEERP
jgi:hypothetical protein